jgi:hypothetical protein
MQMFANIVAHPGGVITWLIVGQIAGFLAGKVMRGAGYGSSATSSWALSGP